jgi:hypothetical protein
MLFGLLAAERKTHTYAIEECNLLVDKYNVIESERLGMNEGRRHD